MEKGRYKCLIELTILTIIVMNEYLTKNERKSMPIESIILPILAPALGFKYYFKRFNKNIANVHSYQKEIQPTRLTIIIYVC